MTGYTPAQAAAIRAGQDAWVRDHDRDRDGHIWDRHGCQVHGVHCPGINPPYEALPLHRGTQDTGKGTT